MSWTLHICSLHCIVMYKTCIYFILGWSLHVHAFQNSCFTSRNESIDFSFYTNFQNPIQWFIGLNVLCSFFHRTQRPLLYDLQDFNVFCFTFQRFQCFLSFTFQRLQCLQSLHLQYFNVFYLLHFKDYNVFGHLHFQRLQCLQSFTLSKTTMSSVIYAF